MLCAALGAIASGWLVDRIPRQELQLAFNLLLIAIGLKLLIYRPSNEVNFENRARQKIAAPLFFLSGSLAGLFGIGGGILNVPILHRILRLPVIESTSLSFFFVFISSGAALLTQFHLHAQKVQQIPDIQLISLLIGTLLGYMLSKKIRLKDQVLRISFACLLFGVALSDLFYR
jgi:uncharacterized membrane protein YfcA